MSKPVVGPWQPSKNGRRGRYITRDGVRYFQWEDENTLQRVDPQPTVQQGRAQIRYDPSPSDIRNVQTTSTLPEQQSPQLASAYAVASGRHGPSQGSVHPSAQDHGVYGLQSSQAPPYSLFPRSENERQSAVEPLPVSHDIDIASPNKRPGRRTTYVRNQAGKQVEYTVSKESYSSQPASGPPPARQGTLNRHGTTQLSRLSQEFIQLAYGDYSACEAFIRRNPDILNEDPNKLLQEAIRLEKEEKHSQAKACVQQALLLRKCLNTPGDGRRAFFSRLNSKDTEALTDFLDDYDRAIDFVRTAAQNERAGTNNAARGRHAQEARHRGTADDELSSGIQRISVSYPNDPVQSSVVGARIGDEDPAAMSGGPPDSGRLTGEPAIEEDGTVGAPSITEVIRGTPRDREDLDPRYYKRPDARKFFTVGRVFALLWHESAGDDRPARAGYMDYTTEGRYGQRVFSHIRRMAVVKERHGFCVCIPINTYGGQGVLKNGLSREERLAHAVIHASDRQPYTRAQERPFLTKKPIAVNMVNKEQQLDKMSRINFGKPQSVEWNVKVLNVGRVAPESMATFTGYYYNEYNL